MMGEVRNWIDKSVYLEVLKNEIYVLKKKFHPEEEGTGHFNTAISVLQSRIEQIESELNWPFPS